MSKYILKRLSKLTFAELKAFRLEFDQYYHKSELLQQLSSSSSPSSSSTSACTSSDVSTPIIHDITTTATTATTAVTTTMTTTTKLTKLHGRSNETSVGAIIDAIPVSKRRKRVANVESKKKVRVEEIYEPQYDEARRNAIARGIAKIRQMNEMKRLGNIINVAQASLPASSDATSTAPTLSNVVKPVSDSSRCPSSASAIISPLSSSPPSSLMIAVPVGATPVVSQSSSLPALVPTPPPGIPLTPQTPIPPETTLRIMDRHNSDERKIELLNHKIFVLHQPLSFHEECFAINAGLLQSDERIGVVFDYTAPSLRIVAEFPPVVSMAPQSSDQLRTNNNSAMNHSTAEFKLNSIHDDINATKTKPGVGASDEATCAICLDSLNLRNETGIRIHCRTLPCFHCFHRECIVQWQQPNCPLCRVEYDVDVLL